MQAIQTKFLSATNFKGSRIKATCERGSLVIPLDYGLSGDKVHRAAADALILRFIDQDFARGIPKETNPWNRRYVTGGMPDGSCAHVFVV